MRKFIPLFLIIFFLSGCIGAGSVTDVSGNGKDTFPKVKGINLMGEEITLPEGFDGEKNLVLVAFKREQQSDVDTWIDLYAAVKDRIKGLKFFEVPTIKPMNSLTRVWINNGMRSGIQDPSARARTITLYVPLKEFTDDAGIENSDQIHAFLLDRKGKIFWRATGPVDDRNKADFLKFAFGP